MEKPPSPPLSVDEIIPPSTSDSGLGETILRDSKGKPQESEVAKFLAKWLDNLLRIPGTDFKIGLDPIIAAFPGIGSTVASGGGLIILIEAFRSRVSVPVMLRMGGNMLLNTAFDYFPLLGPVASAFFKSNSRNLKLLKEWQAGQEAEIKRSTWRLFGVLGLIFLALLGLLAGLFALYVYGLIRLGIFSPSPTVGT